MQIGRALDDSEGERLAAALPPVVDAHVHVFPDRLFAAVQRWFADNYGWPIRYRLTCSRAVVDFLLGRGVGHVVALQYAHKPGIARGLNQYMAELCAESPRVIGAATVFPGEEGAVAILEESFAAGLRLVKMHCHVQCMAPDAKEMHEVYAACARAGRPLVIHAGRGPHSPHYRCDTDALCRGLPASSASSPTTRGSTLVVPHTSALRRDRRLRAAARAARQPLARHHHGRRRLLPHPVPVAPPPRAAGADPLWQRLPQRYAHAWDREIGKLAALGLPEADLAALLGGNARALHRIEDAGGPTGLAAPDPTLPQRTQ